jgi:hypothetical protein
LRRISLHISTWNRECIFPLGYGEQSGLHGNEPLETMNMETYVESTIKKDYQNQAHCDQNDDTL